MRFRLFSIRDRLLGAYLAPFPARADVEAVRQVSNAFSDPAMRQTPIVTSPKDYDLCVLAEFDDETGVIKSLANPEIIKNLAELSPAQLPS